MSQHLAHAQPGTQRRRIPLLVGEAGQVGGQGGTLGMHEFPDVSHDRRTVSPAKIHRPPPLPLCQHRGVRALLLTGVTGVGKSTVADAIGRVLTRAGTTTAVIDADMLAQFGPPPGDIDFYDRLKCTNLAALWANFRDAGARFVVVSAVIETMALRERYAAGLAGCEVRMVRLTAPPEVVRRRLLDRGRGRPPTPGGTPADVADFSVVNDRPPEQVADEVIDRATRRPCG